MTTGADDHPRGSPNGEVSARAAGLLLGLGCVRGASVEEVMALAVAVLGDAGYPDRKLLAIATLDARAHEPAILSVATRFGVPLLGFPAARLEAEAFRLETPSAQVYRLTGCHGVAEASALAAATGDARLLCPKRKSARATAAIVEAESFQALAVVFSGSEQGTSSSESILSDPPPRKGPGAQRARPLPERTQ